MKATVIADASFCPETKAAGWAVWIAADNGKHKTSGRFKAQPISSGAAEVLAALNGIVLAYAMGARDILIQSDCIEVGSMVTKGKWDYAMIRSTRFPDAKVRYRHVKGHTKDEAARSWVNRWCDEEAKKHMKEQRRELKCTKDV